MSEKVKLPVEVAEAIEAHRKCHHDNAIIISQSFEVKDNGAHRNSIRDFASDNFDTFLQALVNGYEVEETPEDKVREYFKQLNDDHGVWSNGHKSSSSPYGYELTGCVRTLNLLGINIKGVND